MQTNLIDYPRVRDVLEILGKLPPDTRIETHGFNSVDVRVMDTVYGGHYVSLVGYAALSSAKTIDNYSSKGNRMVSKAEERLREADRRAGRNPDGEDDLIELFLASDDWNDDEKLVIKWQFRLLGDFKESLFRTIARADDANRKRIALGFPAEVNAYNLWTCSNLATRLREAGLQI